MSGDRTDPGADPRPVLVTGGAGFIGSNLADRLAPHVDRWNAEGGLPLEAVRQMAGFGLFGLSAPEEYGAGIIWSEFHMPTDYRQ